MRKEFFVHPNVSLGTNVLIERGVVIGKPPKGFESGELETIIGSNTVLRTGTVIYAGATIGDCFSTGEYAVVREKVKIGDQSVVGQHCLVLPEACLGNRVTIHSLCLIAEYSKIGDDSWLGPGVITLNTLYPKAFNRSRKEETDREGAPKIGKFVRIGGNVTVNPFVELGDYVVVGAGSVVTKSVPAGKLTYGNPARIIRDVNDLRARYDKSVRPYEH